VDLPMGLVRALETGNCVLFIGAGAGHHAHGPDGSPAPDGRGLALALASTFGIEAGGTLDLAKISEVVQRRKGRLELVAFLEKKLEHLEPDADLRWLMSRTWRAIFTTNYDGVLERCYELDPNPTQTPVSIGVNSEVQDFDPNFQVPIYHLHGSLLTEQAKDAIIITEQDYAIFRAQQQMLFELLKSSYASSTILYFGYSNDDPNWREITSELRSQFAPSFPPIGYRLVPETPNLDREILEGQRIFTLDGYLQDFRAEVDAQLGDIRVEPRKLQALSERVPPELLDLFNDNPAAVLRLLNSWEYVNQAPFDAEANTKEFLQGNRANWALVGNGQSFQRDLEQPLVESLYDFATDPKPRTRSEIILAPAGYGLTTLLMAVTAWFARSRSGTALFLRPGGKLLEADVEFAIRYLPNQPVIFFIDDAAEHERDAAAAVNLAKSLKQPAFFMMAERLNEWRQTHSAIAAVEHELEPLSDNEIYALIDRLEGLNALGQLKYLSSALRISSIKYRNKKDLLVTMREVTEGRAFDGIIEDEYFNIYSDIGKELYALVAIFSRCRALARDGLCSEVLNINLADLYGEPTKSTEGIVFFEAVDESRGIEAARTRHHVIADIVWRRCVSPSMHEHLLLRALDSLNLTYRVDARAFERFTRDDDAVDVLRGLDAKIRFFETAIRKSPYDAFVRQHYARMLRRERKYDLALGQIQEAIEMNPRARVLHHTKGIILRDLALEAPSDDIARRRLTQSEDSLRATINMAPKDDYGYSDLARLYLDWARKASSDESIRYVAKAQEVVFEGLRLARERESLYIAMSDIERYLGDEPARLQSLEKAVREAPRSPVARYLLGSVLLKQGRVAEAVSVLSEGITQDPEHPRMAINCAIAMYRNKQSFDECLAVLNLARNVGMSDPYYVSVLAGMLVLKGNLSDAAELWTRARQHHFAISERDRPFFIPTDLGHSGWVAGRVAHVGPSFMFVKVAGYPDVYCASRRIGGQKFSSEQRVDVKIGFSARGATAVDLRAAES
jgi:tetratricopeptide (TPR) repeat protein